MDEVTTESASYSIWVSLLRSIIGTDADVCRFLVAWFFDDGVSFQKFWCLGFETHILPSERFSSDVPVTCWWLHREQR